MIFTKILIVVIPIVGILIPAPSTAIGVSKGVAKGGLNIDEHTRLTKDKRVILDKFRARVLPKLTQEFMKNDLYLLRFLEAKKFDADKAELMLLNHLQFREENKMDGIHEEDWSDFEKDYPYRVEGVDKLGRPIVQVDFGKWDINKATELGKQNRLLRWYNKMLDEATMKVLDLQSHGKNVTQWVCLGNAMGVSTDQHVGFKSSRFYYDGANTLENNHPGMSSGIIAINAHDVFVPIVGLARSVLSEETNGRVKSYRDPEEWKPVLDSFIDPEQLGPDYGGTKGTKETPALLAGAYQRQKDGSWRLWKLWG